MSDTPWAVPVVARTGFRCGRLLAWPLLLLPVCGCDRQPPPPAAPAAAAPAPTNRIDVPEAVRRNLGITFAKVERRAVAQTVRVPGAFELIPEARREYRTMLAGRVELLVGQFARVEAGTPLYRLVSPEWRDLQSKLIDAESTIRQSEARVASIPLLIAAHRRHEKVLEETIALWEERVAQLEQSRASGVVTGDDLTSARNTLAQHRADLAEILEKEADLEGQVVAAQAEHDAAHVRFRMLIATAAMVLGVPETEICATDELEEHLYAGIHAHTRPAARPPSPWRTIAEVQVRADAAGVVEAVSLTNGAWASSGSLVVATVQPERLRFRARGLQSDLARLRDGLSAKIVPPAGGAVAAQQTMPARLTLGLAADPQERTVELIAVPEALQPWARAGVSAHLEIITDGGSTEPAIPLACVVPDGLTRVIFRRDPRDPDKVIRLDADLGIDDGRWVVIQSGVRDGDEVVVTGNYQLMLATSGTAVKGGHFHADGTYHEGEH